jgi:hypothetical protein
MLLMLPSEPMSEASSYPDLLARIREALEAPVRETTGHEPAFVWSIFQGGLGKLREELTSDFGSAVSVNGVFCHGRPVVEFDHPEAPTSTRGCELGDLLIVVNHVFPHGVEQGRALLLQCKMAGKAGVPRRQKLLYRDWPRFSYQRHPEVRRKVSPAPHTGAQFAFIHSDDGKIIVGQESKEPRSANPWKDSLASSVVAMINPPPGGGRLFLPQASRFSDPHGWSPVVWDLLQTAFSNDSYTGNARVFEAGSVSALLELASPLPNLLASSEFAAQADALRHTVASGDYPFDGDAPPPEERPVYIDSGDAGVPTILIEFDWSGIQRDRLIGSPTGVE